MKPATVKYRVLVPTALFGTVRVAKGDVVPRELLGINLKRLVEQGVVEPMVVVTPKGRLKVSLI